MATAHSSNTSVNIPDSIKREFLADDTIGHWKHDIEQYLKNQNWSALINQPLAKVIDEARQAEALRLTSIDENDEIEKMIFRSNYDEHATRLALPKTAEGTEGTTIPSDTLEAAAFRQYIDKRKKEQAHKFATNPEARDKLFARLRQVEDIWTSRHDNLTTAMMQSMTPNFASQRTHLSNSYDLFQNIIGSASTSFQTQEQHRSAFEAVQLEPDEMFTDCLARLTRARYALELSGRPVTDAWFFARIMTALPSKGPRDFSPITFQYNRIKKNFDPNDIPDIITDIKEYERKNAMPVSPSSRLPSAHAATAMGAGRGHATHPYPTWCTCHGWTTHDSTTCAWIKNNPGAGPTPKAMSEDPSKPPSKSQRKEKASIDKAAESALIKAIQALSARVSPEKVLPEKVVVAPPAIDLQSFMALLASANKGGSYYSFILDSGATPQSMAPAVPGATPAPGPPITLADQSSTPSTGVGTLDVQGMTIQNVLQVPALNHGLLSIPSLVRDHDKSVHFGASGTDCHIIDKSTGHTTSIPLDPATNLWMIHPKGPPANTALLTQNMLWHRRSMFTGNRYLHKATEHVKGLGKITQDDRPCHCQGCMAGKAHALPWPGKDHTSAFLPGESWHFDIWGKAPQATPSGEFYLLCGTDEKSGLSHGTLLRKRSEALEAIRNVLSFSYTQTGRKIRQVTLDLAGEFKSQELQEYMNSRGIKLQYAPARTKEMNALAERKFRTLTEKMRAALWDSGLPHKYWGSVITASIHVLNRLPQKRSAMKTPYEVFFERGQPDISYFRRIGCIGWVFIAEKARQNKLDARATRCTLVGYPSDSKGYNMLELSTGKIITTRHVIFNEEETYRDIPHEGSFATTTTLEEFEIMFGDEPKDATHTEDTTHIVGTTANPYDVLETERHIYEEVEDKRAAPATPNTTTTDTTASETDSFETAESDPDPATDEDPESQQPQDAPPNAGEHDPDPAPIAEFDVDPQLWHDPPPEDSAPPTELPYILQPTAEAGVYTDTSGGKVTIQDSNTPAAKDILAGPAHASRREGSRIGARALSANTTLPADTTDHGPAERGEPDLGEDITEDILPPTEELPPPAFPPDESPFVLQGETVDLTEPIPKTFKQAIASANATKWMNAMEAELAAHRKNSTFDETESKLQGYIALGCRWKYALKLEKGLPHRFKARLCLQGFRQRYGHDYVHTSSPVVKVESLRLILLLASILDLECHTMDVDTAYLNASLNELLYAKIPDLYEPIHKGTKYLIVRKALYGAKQSGRAWYELLTAFLRESSFTQLKSDPCVFHNHDKTLFICIYVDDLLLAGTPTAMTQFKSTFKARFKCKDPGPVTEFLGFEVHRSRSEKSLLLTQFHYTKDLFSKYAPWLDPIRPSTIPGTPGIDLSVRFLPDPDTEEVAFIASFPYREMIGSLQYLTNTRPEIHAALSQLSSYVARPRKIHCQALLKIFSYLKTDMSAPIGIKLGGNPTFPLRIVSHADADWGKDMDTRRSRYGSVLTVNGSPIRISAGLQSTVHQATSHAELDAANAGARDIVYARQFLDELKIPYSQPVLHSDNTGAQAIAENDTLAKGSRHLDIKLFWIRELIGQDLLKMVHCPTKSMIADILTKNLPRPQFDALLPSLSVMSLSRFNDITTRGGVGPTLIAPSPP